MHDPTIAEIEAARAGALESYAVYLEDPREYVSNGEVAHGLTPGFRAMPTRSGGCSDETKRRARQLARQCAYSNEAFIVEQRWDSQGRHWVESVLFVATPSRVVKA